MEKAVLAIIPARGGSKGIPRKNLKLLAGQPLVRYAIEAAKGAKKIHRVIVSTDDEEIAKVSRGFGAETPFLRPQEYATDEASSVSVVLHVLDWLKRKENYSPEVVIFLPPTCPLRRSSQIDEAVELLQKSPVDSVVSVFEPNCHPYFIYSLQPDATLQELVKMAKKPLRRQDLPRFVAQNQTIAVSRRSYFEKSEVDDSSAVFNFKSMLGYVVDPPSAIDIDTLADFAVAEALIQAGYYQEKWFNALEATTALV